MRRQARHVPRRLDILRDCVGIGMKLVHEIRTDIPQSTPITLDRCRIHLLFLLVL
jgi:hypothetical protein